MGFKDSTSHFSEYVSQGKVIKINATGLCFFFPCISSFVNYLLRKHGYRFELRESRCNDKPMRNEVKFRYKPEFFITNTQFNWGILISLRDMEPPPPKKKKKEKLEGYLK